jgi:hypothetical protein
MNGYACSSLHNAKFPLMQAWEAGQKEMLQAERGAKVRSVQKRCHSAASYKWKTANQRPACHSHYVEPW